MLSTADYVFNVAHTSLLEVFVFYVSVGWARWVNCQLVAMEQCLNSLVSDHDHCGAHSISVFVLFLSMRVKDSTWILLVYGGAQSGKDISHESLSFTSTPFWCLLLQNYGAN
jgi:hypothetical protein